MADKKTTYDYTYVIPVKCEKCGHEQKEVRRVTSTKTLLNEPVKPEYEVEHTVEKVKTIEDYNEEERQRIEDETGKPLEELVDGDPETSEESPEIEPEEEPEEDAEEAGEKTEGIIDKALGAD